MKCQEIKKKIPLYIDGTLVTKDYSLFEQHISECKKCKKEYDAYYMLIKELNNMRVPLPSNEEWEKIHKEIINSISSLPLPTKEKKIFSFILWKATSSYRIKAVAALILLSLISISAFKIFYLPSHNGRILAEVIDVEGKKSFREERNKFIKKQSKILPGEAIITDEEATLQVRIEKSILKVGKNSEVKIAELKKEKTEIELLNGDINAEVSKRKRDQLFRIKTPNAVCEVVGTKFNVSTQYDRVHKKYITTLTVDEGIVNFGSNFNKIEVGSGKGITLFGDSLGSIVEKNDPLIEQLIKLKGKGYIYLSSFPESAMIFINKEFVGYTPLRIIKPFGSYEIGCKKEGFNLQIVNVEVSPEKINNIKFTLESNKKGASVLALSKENISDSLYLKATQQINEGKFENAIVILNQLIKNKNTSREIKSAAIGKALICYKNIGNYNKFIETVDLILKGDFPDNQKANALFERATIYKSILSEPEKSIKDLKLYLKNFSNSIWSEEASYLLGELYFNLMKYKEASVEYENFCNKYKNSSRREYVLYKLATIYANFLNDPSRALETYNRIALEFPESKYMEDVIFGSADCLLRSGNTTKAIREFNNYLKKYPQGKWAVEAKFRLSKFQSARTN